MVREIVHRIATTPFEGQRPGTSGLRKKTRVFMQPHYLENFVQSIFNCLREDDGADLRKEILIIGGDGRYFNRQAIQTIVRMCAANGVGKILVGRGGILSTPAMSAAIRRRGAIGGILLSASHNPGGIDGDFGVKFNARNGGPAPQKLTDRIYGHTQVLKDYLMLGSPDLELDRIGSIRLAGSEVEVIDPLADYTAVMESLFDFDILRALFRSGFHMVFDGMHGVTGPYARHILEGCLGAPEGTVIRGVPLEDFGGHHPDPNLAHAAELIERMDGPDAPELGAACDGDGDRNLILGRGFFVTPGDSVAVIARHAPECIPGYRGGLSGVARSMPTSTALDRVARRMGIPCHETPTGWKFFGNLMDAGKCTICGEESFGTGSDHVREKDGLWAVLSWLSILAVIKKPVSDVVKDLWLEDGRSYFQRHDYEGLDVTAAGNMIESIREGLPSLEGTEIAGSTVTMADDFSYVDPVDGSVSRRQGIRIILSDGSRIVFRLSGTGTEGATLRLYFERLRFDWDAGSDSVLQPLIDAAQNLLQLRSRVGRDRPTVIT
ncbi:MAG: alpha-D-glucose phosphate-specific phosphoglucomutase [Acidobacteria bacterium]|nr:alpha-D-glucose phosphate-specific phosphoglucomutase [Acidobacteriota bacterium]